MEISGFSGLTRRAMSKRLIHRRLIALESKVTADRYTVRIKIRFAENESWPQWSG
jgi:hypothetical protein